MIDDPSAGAYSASRVRRSFLHFLVGKSASAFVAFILLLMLVRVMEREEYGLYIVLLAALEIVSLASSLGVYPALYRYIPELRAMGRGRALARLIAAASIWRLITLAVASGAFAFMAPTLAPALGFASASTIFALYAWVILFEGLARFFDVVFESLLMQGAAQISILLRNGLRLAGVFFLVSLGPVKLHDWVMIEIIASISSGVFAVWFVSRKSCAVAHSQPGDLVSLSLARVKAYAVPAYLAQFVGVLQGPDVVKVLVAKLAGAVETGAFGFAAAVGGMLQRYLPVFLLIGMVRPLFVSQHAGSNGAARLVELANLVFKLNVFVIAPMTILFLVAGEQVSSVLSGGKFPEGGPYLVAFSFLLITQSLRTVLGLIALAVEEGRASLHGTLFGLGGLVAGLVAYPAYGPLALCGGLIVSDLIWCGVMRHALRGHGVRFVVDLGGLLKLWGLAAAASLPIWALQVDIAIGGNLRLAMVTVLMALLYLVLARVFRPFSKTERGLINRVLPRPVFIW